MCLYFHAHSGKQFPFQMNKIMMPRKREREREERKERKIRISEESKLLRLELKPCGAQESCNILFIKSSSNKCEHIGERERERREREKSCIWIQQRVSLIILDNGELSNSTFDPLLCEVHYYLFQIIVHFKSPTMKKHVKTLKEHLVPSPKAL